MHFDPKKVAFSRHESFPLRFGWLTKGFQALQGSRDVFSSEDATVTLGVGKNMVNAIKHWLKATSMVEASAKGLIPTELGRALFSEDGWDPYLEDEATIWLIHWMLATNPTQATAWYWFFNRYHKPEFTNTEAATALLDFAKEHVNSKFAATSVKKDAAVLLRSYIQKKNSSRTPVEEVLDSPLSLLNLISYSPQTKMYHSKLSEKESLPIGVFGYAINEFFRAQGTTQCPIEDLMYSKDGFISPGSAFRLTENALIGKIEGLISYIPNIFKLDDTAGIHQLYKLEEITSVTYLKVHYEYLPWEAAE